MKCVILVLLLGLIYALRRPSLPIKPTEAFKQRRETLISHSLRSGALYCQVVRVMKNTPVATQSVLSALEKIDARLDCADFTINAILRMLYIDLSTHTLPGDLKEKMKKSVLGFKYWFDEPGHTSTIFGTENHMILFHTAELLAGLLYPNEHFSNSGMTGTQHVKHAKEYIMNWIDHRGKLGFTEWLSNIYANQVMGALLNLIDFSQDPEIEVRASMLMDTLAFVFACNYFAGRYAAPHARTNDDIILGQNNDHTREAAWLMLGLSTDGPGSNLAANFLATSKHVVPPILEEIALDSKEYFEHKERNSIGTDEWKKYGIGHKSVYDKMYWMSMSGFIAPEVIKGTMELFWYYDMSGELNGINSKLFVAGIYLLSWVHFMSPAVFSKLISDLTQGVALETANIYTYRTPHYQLSGTQDRQKGMNGMQDHHWQATLDEKAHVFANSPGSFRGTKFAGGWKPRGTFYKNIAVLQYDRRIQVPELEVIYWFLEGTGYMHVFFPKKEFDDIVRKGNWIFGVKGKGYIGLYSYEPLEWVNDYELRSKTKKNTLIVEMGDPDFGPFYTFVERISKSWVRVVPKTMGFNVEYVSPTQGRVKVSWDGPMTVQGKEVDLGPYPRFDNKYCRQEFGQDKSTIVFGGKALGLDFEKGKREYYQWEQCVFTSFYLFFVLLKV
eukprot:TRINITY_DN1831_c0_g2_i1.p1 TRINITY_DN1831_c0_g2~~TRINITY_DN1831_c0_g2_i1.p1  ORF type:complete len:697 (+),score=53.19 TRINITY_DN1831_c0_g2_i1:85-2091(+)